MAVFDNLQGTYSAGLAPEITQYYSKTFLRDFQSNLVHTKDLQKRPLPLNNGNTVNFRKLMPFAPITEPLKEGITPAGQTLNMYEIHATVKPYGGHVEVTDELSLTSIDNIHKETASLLSRQAVETIEKVAADALNSGLNVLYVDAANGTNTSRSDITAADVLTGSAIKRAVRALEKANAQRFPDGYYHAIVDPETKFDLTNDPLWIDVAKYQQAGKVEKYELGKLLGVKFYETTLTKTFTSDQVLYTDAGVGVTNLALNGGAWSVTNKTGYFTIAKTTAYASGTDNDYAYWCRRMVGKMVRVYDASETSYINALIDQAFVDGTNLKCTLRYLDTATDWAYASGDKVYSQSGGASNYEVHSTIIYGQDYAGSIELGGNGGNVQTIIKEPGSSGAADPLNQRGSIAWKIKGMCVTILQDAYCVRVEHGVSA